jgi:hypothetical protein
MPVIALIAASLFVIPVPSKPQGSGYVPIVVVDPTPPPVPPNYPPPPPPNPAMMADSEEPFTTAVTIGSQGDFAELSANYELTVDVIEKQVEKVVKKTRPLQSPEKVEGAFISRSTRISSSDPCYGAVHHGRQATLKFYHLEGKAVQLTLKRTFPIGDSKKTYKLSFIVPRAGMPAALMIGD